MTRKKNSLRNNLILANVSLNLHLGIGAIAQLGERLNGIQEVSSSILLSSTEKIPKKFGIFNNRRNMVYVYIIYSKRRDRYYIGQTENIEKRIKEHNAGYTKSTKCGKPWELKYHEEYMERQEAVQRERDLKKQKSRKIIEDLIYGRASR